VTKVTKTRAMVAILAAVSVLLMGAGGGCEREGGKPKPAPDPAALDKAGKDRKSVLLSMDWDGERPFRISINGPDGRQTIEQKPQKKTGGFFRHAIVIPKKGTTIVEISGAPIGSSKGKVSCSLKYDNKIVSPKNVSSGAVGPCRMGIAANGYDPDEWPTPLSARDLPSITFEGMIIQFPDGAPNAQTWQQGRSRRDRAVLIFQWSGQRNMVVEWYRSSPTLPTISRAQEVKPKPASNGISTFAVIVEVDDDTLVDIGGEPIRQQEGTARCTIYHQGHIADEASTTHGSVACTAWIRL